MSGNKRDVEKERQWHRVVQQAARSGMSIREFCRRRRIDEHQFYWWRQRLSERVRRQQADEGEVGHPEAKAKQAATFALVSTEPGSADAGIELVLEGGRRLRIGKGVDESTLRTVLAAVERARC